MGPMPNMHETGLDPQHHRFPYGRSSFTRSSLSHPHLSTARSTVDYEAHTRQSPNPGLSTPRISIVNL